MLRDTIGLGGYTGEAASTPLLPYCIARHTLPRVQCWTLLDVLGDGDGPTGSDGNSAKVKADNARCYD